MPQLGDGPATGSAGPGSNICGAQAIFPNRTHLVPYDDPEQFNSTVERFLATPFKKIDRIPETMGSFEKMMGGLAH